MQVTILYPIVGFFMSNQEHDNAIKINIVMNFLIIVANGRRYVQLAQSRGGASFCNPGAVHGYAVSSLFSRWQKP